MTGSLPDGLMIADDFTGALDSSVEFAERGWRVEVIHWRALAGGWPQRADRGAGPILLAVDTQSRSLEPGEAMARIRQVAATLMPLSGSAFVFKKVDSRLKGNIVAEVQGLAAGLDRSAVLFCPAVPEAGRLIQDGAFKDLALGSRIMLPDFGAGLNVSCPDVRTVADLDRAARMFLESGMQGIAVGARGLAESLANCLAPSPSPRPVRELEAPTCFVVGTNDPVTAAQVEHLRQARPDIPQLGFPRDSLPAAVSGSSILLRLVAISADDFTAQLPGYVRWANAVAVGQGAKTLIVSGGDTLRAFADAVGWTGLVPLRSLGGGLVLAEPSDGGGRLVVSKSGGFGHLSAFSDLAALAGRGGTWGWQQEEP